MKQIKFNLPEGWTVSFKKKTQHAVNPADGDEWDFTIYEYEISPPTDGVFSWIKITKLVDGDSNPYETIEYMAEGYLDSLDLPNVLRPAASEYVGEFGIGDITAYYFVDQKPREDAAIIRFAFETPDDHQYVFADAGINDDVEISSALDFLSGMFDFS